MIFVFFVLATVRVCELGANLYFGRLMLSACIHGRGHMRP